MQGEKYSGLANTNRIRIKMVAPKRGVICDRNGKDLVINKRQYACAIFGSNNLHDILSAINKVESILHRRAAISAYGEGYIKNKIKQQSKCIIIEEDLSWDDIVMLEEYAFLHGDTKLQIIAYDMRSYEYSDICAHVIGYVSKPSIEELNDAKLSGDNLPYVGRDGVEKSFDSMLRGHLGFKKIEVDSTGNKANELFVIPGEAGKGVRLSLDYDVQKCTADAMRNLRGSVVVMSPYSGKVLALYSSPGYDANLFTKSITPTEWESTSRNNTFINKAIQASYPPASIFKIVSALAILESNVDYSQKMFCNGEYTVGNRTFHCWKKHGYVNLHDAIAQSCNAYFYAKSLKVGVDAIMNVAQVMGLGKKTGIALPGEISGMIPDAEWRNGRAGGRWSLGDTANIAIGQGALAVTPMQLAVMMSRLVSGSLITPQILSSSDEQIPLYAPSLGQQSDVSDRLKLSEKSRKFVMSSLFSVFDSKKGTGYYKKKILLPSGVDVAGKTGTAQIISQRESKFHRFNDHGIFLGYSPYKHPKYAISVVIENGGWGSVSALPVAMKILRALSKPG